ncbi:hypothetical protein [Emticicia soli]|uniref:Uncharacterized protein n=1 Tax=Emticicia soli TaxID=2027878 RepID=A0ABW5JEP0_9BACT
MIIYKEIANQMQEFCDLNTPDEIRENTRVLTLALAQSDYFEVLDKPYLSEILNYLHQVEDILLSVHQIKIKLYEGK